LHLKLTKQQIKLLVAANEMSDFEGAAGTARGEVEAQDALVRSAVFCCPLIALILFSQLRMAEHLGIDTVNEPHLLWIAGLPSVFKSLHEDVLEIV
jgi:hypothetical protein